MKRRKPFLSISLGLCLCLVAAVALADDTVTLTVWGSTNHPDNPSSISVNNGQFVKTFTDDSAFNNVTVTDDGTGAGSVLIAQGDIQFAPSSDTFSGFTFIEQLRAQSDLNGTYDRNSGSATATVLVDLKITSPNAPGFNNTTCILPAIAISATTDTGVPYSGGAGKLVDNTFAVGQFAHGSCGIFLFIDYADQINGQLHLPAAAGTNVLTLANSMNPALPP